jgi:thiamine phosphate synthase YjbQ (UPF0047 family)
MPPLSMPFSVADHLGYTENMKSYRKVLEFNVPSRMAFLNITPQVQAALKESSIREGMCLVKAKHI